MTVVTSNTPLYQLGDVATLTGADQYVSTPYYSYYYDESSSAGYSYIYESYSYYTPGGMIDSSEYFNYNLDSGNEVTGVSTSVSDYNYDSSGRQILYSYTGEYVSADYVSTYSDIEEFIYSGSTGYQLDTSTSTYTSSSTYSNGYSYVYNSVTTSDYDYTGMSVSQVYSPYDWVSRRDIEEVDDDGDSITDYINYTLITQQDTQSGAVYTYSDSYTTVTTDPSGSITGSSVSDYTSTSNSNTGAYTSSSTYSNAYDSDADGIIEYTYQSTYNYTQNSQNGLYISKSDYDEDGDADYVSISKTSQNMNSGSAIYLDYQSGSYNSPSTLSIEISRDLDGDTIYDNTTGFTFGWQAPSSLTAMGGHVATLADTYF